MARLSSLLSLLLLHALPGFSSPTATHHLPCSSKAVKRPTLFGAQILALTTAERHAQNVTTQAGNSVVISYCEVNMYVPSEDLLISSWY